MSKRINTSGDYTIETAAGQSIILNTDDVQVNGDLTVSGTTTTIDTENVTIKDNVIVLNNGEPGAGVTLGSAGLEIDRGSSTNANILFDETADAWFVDNGDGVPRELNTGGGTSLANIVEDLTPQLGGTLDVNGQTIVSVSAGDIVITPDTTGEIILDGLKWPQADGTAGYSLKTDGFGQLAWAAGGGGLANVVEDITPQLGGDLDVNGQAIISASAGNINITPDTTGSVVIDGLNWPQADGALDEVLKTDGAGQLSWGVGGGGGDVNIDGGFAASVYLPSQTFNGGAA